MNNSTISHDSSLLPCPCCGSEPLVHDRVGIFDCGVFVECPACGLRTGEAAYYTREGFPAVLDKRPDMDREHVFVMVCTSWNMRTPQPEPPRRARRYLRPHYVPVYKVRGLQ